MGFPTSIVADIATTSTQTLAAASHNQVHLDDRDEIRALETKVGTGASTPVAGTVMRGTGTGTSGWGAIVNADVDASAAIAVSKLANGTKGYGLLANTSGGLYEPVARKNRLYNGAMRVSQRLAYDLPTTVQMVDNSYQVADRWRSLSNVSGNAPYMYVSEGMTPNNGISRHALTMVSHATTPGTGKFGIFQVVESRNCWDLRGQSVSLQAKIWASSGSVFTDVRMAILEWTGGADDANILNVDPISGWGTDNNGLSTVSGNWAIRSQTSSLAATNAWTTYKLENVSFTASPSNIAVVIWMDEATSAPGTSNYLIVTDVQLEKGAICTDFERIPYPQDLEGCRRYYRVWGGRDANEYVAVGEAESGTVSYIPIQLDPAMRAAPTVTVSAANNWILRCQGSGNACTAVTSAGVSTPDVCVVSATVSSGLAAGYATALVANGTTSARLHLSAEL